MCNEEQEIFCLYTPPDSCMYWSSPEIKELGITKDMRYHLVMRNLINSYLEYKNAKFDLDCLLDGKCGNCENPATRDQAIQSLLNKICNLSAEDISVTSSRTSGISTYAGKYVGSALNYSIQGSENGSKLNLNLLDGIPSDAAVKSTRVVISGKSSTGKNIILDTNEKISSTTIRNESYPITVDATIRVQTEGGIVDLNKSFTLNNPTEVGQFKEIYQVSDRASSGQFSGKLSELIGSYEATQNQLLKYQEQLQNTDQGDIVNTVRQNSYTIGELRTQVEDMKYVNLSLSELNGTTTTKKMSPQEAVDKLSDMVNNLLTDNTDLKSQITSMQNKLGNISNPTGGGIVGSTSEGNTSLSTGVTSNS